MLLLARVSSLAISLLAATGAHAAVVAGPYENPANGHLYSLLAPTTWDAAESEAVALGGHLVAIVDAAENSWVWATFSPLFGGPLWIGFNDVAVEGTFVWTSGRPTDYTSWWEAGGQPSGDGDAVEMNNSLWNDNDAANPFRAVVEVVPNRAALVQVDWTADVTGPVGAGTLVGSFGVFEVAFEGELFDLPPGAELVAAAGGFVGGFANRSYTIEQGFNGLAVRFDSVDPISISLAGNEGSAFANRFGTPQPCGDQNCRVGLHSDLTGNYEVARALRGYFDNGSYFESTSEGPLVYTYTYLPEAGTGTPAVAIAVLAALWRRKRA